MTIMLMAESSNPRPMTLQLPMCLARNGAKLFVSINVTFIASSGMPSIHLDEPASIIHTGRPVSKNAMHTFAVAIVVAVMIMYGSRSKVKSDVLSTFTSSLSTCPLSR